jgi:hypothetical protein
MDCPKILRKYIVIDGEHTVELDYAGMHIHLLYAIEGINYAEKQEDPYVLEGFPNRDANKYVFLIAINAENDDSFVRGAWGRIVKKKKIQEYGITNQQQLRDILNALRSKHPRIAHHIASGYGVKLQNIDAQMAHCNVSPSGGESWRVCLMNL